MTIIGPARSNHVGNGAEAYKIKRKLLLQYQAISIGSHAWFADENLIEITSTTRKCDGNNMRL